MITEGARRIVGRSLWLVAGCGPIDLPIDSGTASAGATSGSSSTSGEVTTTEGGTAGTSSSTGTTGSVECVPPVGAPLELAYVVQATGTGKQAMQAVALDALGNTYVAGTFTDQSVLDGGRPSMIGAGLRAPFVAKFDCAGELVWLTTATSESNSSGDALALAVTDTDVYVGGTFAGSIQFTPEPVLVGGSGSAFVARFDAATGAPSGCTVLADGAIRVNGLAIGGDGTVYAAGECQADANTFGILLAELPPTLGVAAPRCAYTAAVLNNPHTTRASALAIHPDGGLVVAGKITGPLTGLGFPAVLGPADGFVARVPTPLPPSPANPFGGAWIRTLGGSEERDRVNGVAVMDDGSGDIVAVGLGKGQFFPGGPAGCQDTSGALWTAFVTRLTRDNECVAHEMLESDPMQSTEAHAVAVRDGTMYVLGQFARSLGIGGAPIGETNLYGIRMFVLALTAGLEPQAHFFSDQESNQSTCSPTEEARALGTGIAAGADVVTAVVEACGDGVGVGANPLAATDTALLGFPR